VSKAGVTSFDGRRFLLGSTNQKATQTIHFSRKELEAKAILPARFRNGASVDEMQASVRHIWKLGALEGCAAILPTLRPLRWTHRATRSRHERPEARQASTMLRACFLPTAAGDAFDDQHRRG
jgi:hypothetical protein